MSQPAYYTFLANDPALTSPVPTTLHDTLLDAAFGSSATSPQRQTIAASLSHFSSVLQTNPGLLNAPLREEADAASVVPSVVELQVKPADAALQAYPKVVVAIMDESLPFSNASAASGFASVWVQGAKPVAGETLPWLPFGHDIKGVHLGALARGTHKQDAHQLYKRLAALPRTARYRLAMERRFSHGASVLGQLIRGRGLPQHPMVGVSFPTKVVQDTSGAMLPYFAICGLLHVMAVARLLSKNAGRELPVVVNMSYGVLAGAKTGKGKFEEALAAIGDPTLKIPNLGPVHIVLPMGNGRLSRTIARVDAGSGTQTLKAKLLPDDRTPSFIEIRRAGTEPLKIEVTPPYASTSVPIQRNTSSGETITPVGRGCTAICRNEDGDELILLCFAPTAFRSFHKETPSRSGSWSLKVTRGTKEARLSIQRDDSLDGIGSGGRQSRFIDSSYEIRDKAGRIVALDDDADCPIKRAGTVSAFASAHYVWRVGACFAYRGGSVPYSGLGHPSIVGEQDTGDVTRISDRSPNSPGILSTSLAGGGATRVSGTSISAARFSADLADFLASIVATPNEQKARDRDYVLSAMNVPDTLAELPSW